jgi:hypothetical protein
MFGVSGSSGDHATLNRRLAVVGEVLARAQAWSRPLGPHHLSHWLARLQPLPSGDHAPEGQRSRRTRGGSRFSAAKSGREFESDFWLAARSRPVVPCVPEEPATSAALLSSASEERRRVRVPLVIRRETALAAWR